MTHPLRGAVLVVTAVIGVAGCGAAPLSGTPGADIAILPTTTVPTTLNGLTVKPEKVDKALKQAKHSYLDGFGFYSLRMDKAVEGTLEVGQFGPSARLGNADFRNQIIVDSSPGTPTAVDVGGTTIEQSSGTKSTVSIWFSQDRLVVLTVLTSYTGSRGLLEQTLAALPGR